MADLSLLAALSALAVGTGRGVAAISSAAGGHAPADVELELAA